MIASGTIDTTRLTISLKANALTVMHSTDDVLTYDLSGRLWLRFNSGRTYRRGLDGRVMEKVQSAEGRHRRWLSSEEAAALLDESALRLRRLQQQLAAGAVGWVVPPDDAMLAAIERAARFDARAAAVDQARFTAIYEPIGILPPDQYMALVLQATVGCSFNTCTFCGFYKTQRFRIKSVEEFRAHALAVRAYFGAGLSLRQSIFLGEANALALPYDRLVPLFAATRELFPERPISAFLDAFSGTKKSAGHYHRLAEDGLERVNIGMESGHDPLLRFVRKPGAAQDVIEAVIALKQAGVAVNVIVLVGLGGDRYAEGHVRDTVALLDAMPLDAGDIIYYSDLVEHSATPYPALARAAGIRPLTEPEMQAQRQAIQARLRCGADAPRHAIYDIREWIY